MYVLPSLVAHNHVCANYTALLGGTNYICVYVLPSLVAKIISVRMYCPPWWQKLYLYVCTVLLGGTNYICVYVLPSLVAQIISVCMYCPPWWHKLR